MHLHVGCSPVIYSDTNVWWILFNYSIIWYLFIQISSEVNNLSTQIPVKHTERTSGMTEVPVTGNRKKTTEGTDQYSVCIWYLVINAAVSFVQKSSDVSDLSRPTTNNHNEKLWSSQLLMLEETSRKSSKKLINTRWVFDI